MLHEFGVDRVDDDGLEAGQLQGMTTVLIHLFLLLFFVVLILFWFRFCVLFGLAAGGLHILEVKPILSVLNGPPFLQLFDRRS